MELKDTIALMQSDDYKDRFKAEYFQTKIRYDKLHKMLIKLDAGTLDFKPTCSKIVLLEQKRHMGEYIRNICYISQINTIWEKSKRKIRAVT